jgi:hypothetical protein
MQIDDSIISTVLSPINVHLGASHTYDAPATAQVRTSRMSPIASAVLPGSPGERAVKRDTSSRVGETTLQSANKVIADTI